MKRAVWMTLALALAACGGEKQMPPEGDGENTEEAAEKDASPEGLAKLAIKIKAEPAKASDTLKAAGWDVAEFEAALVDVARDPDKSKTYTVTLNK